LLIGPSSELQTLFRNGFCAGLNDLVSDQFGNSYRVTLVTWSESSIIFVTDLFFDNVHVADSWNATIYFGYNSDLDSIVCPFNPIETNILNDIQILEDRNLSVEGPYSFVFVQRLEDSTLFINTEDAYIELDLFVVQSGYQQSWAWISNEDVTFLTE